jgi:two-component system cell cycle sensor histidine kinase/response regulator CckA
MPVMDGVELVKKAHDILPDLTIIYISGYAEDSFRQKVGQDEMIHFLPKPFSLKELARKVKDVIQEQKQEIKQLNKSMES